MLAKNALVIQAVLTGKRGGVSAAVTSLGRRGAGDAHAKY